jgi:hypothetical protein
MTFLTLLLLLQQSASPRIPCPDLSGNYVIQGEDGRVYVSIVQNRCKRVAIEWNNNPSARSKHVLVLDGQFHADGGWFGFRGRQLTSAQLHSDKLEIVAKPTKSADTSTFLWKHVLERLPNGDLCTWLVDSHGNRLPAMLAARTKSKGRVGEVEAARRSEEGCS